MGNFDSNISWFTRGPIFETVTNPVMFMIMVVFCIVVATIVSSGPGDVQAQTAFLIMVSPFLLVLVLRWILGLLWFRCGSCCKKVRYYEVKVVFEMINGVNKHRCPFCNRDLSLYSGLD